MPSPETTERKLSMSAILLAQRVLKRSPTDPYAQAVLDHARRVGMAPPDPSHVDRDALAGDLVETEHGIWINGKFHEVARP